jgi:O-acetylhomoserine (thiol)-lyase
MRFSTKLLHSGWAPDEKTGATNSPIYQSVAFRRKKAEELEEIFRGSRPGFVYSRLNNPTVEAFERRLALLEGGVAAVACASGMSAVSLAVLNIVRSGDEIVAGSGTFGGTYSLFRNLEDFGITTRYAGDVSAAAFEACITDRTRALFVETIGNPKLDVADIGSLAGLAHRYGLPLVVDSTVTTPYLVNPLLLGADIVVHSTSKYINGSGNSIGGIIVDGGRFKWDAGLFPKLEAYKKFGPFAYTAKLRAGLHKDLGPAASPFNVFMTSTGLDTLELRMERCCQTARRLAEYLVASGKVRAVNYPGLADNAYRDIADRQFAGKFGALLTLRLGTKERAFTVLDNLRYVLNLANIGDARTLAIHPASTIYIHSSEAEKEQAGVYSDLIRVSVGLEDYEDLVEDFAAALALI